MLKSVLLVSLSISSALAATRECENAKSLCDVSKLKVAAGTLPLQTASTSFVALGIGYQNYTCSSAGTYASAGAVATIFDISCLRTSSAFSKVSKAAYDVWNRLPSHTDVDASAAIRGVNPPFNNVVLGQHYFVQNPLNASAGISPRWDFTARFHDPQSYVVAAKSGGVPALENPTQNVDWLELKPLANQGQLAQEIYRTETHGGQPPSTCAFGSSPISVKYTALYWLTGGHNSHK